MQQETKKRSAPQQRAKVYAFFIEQIDFLESTGKYRTSESYRQTLSSLKQFHGETDFSFRDINSTFVNRYECWMKSRHLCRNTTSFYMRILRAVFNKAVDQHFVSPAQPFRHVYTGIDKTAKRAISIAEIKRLLKMDCTATPGLCFARDLFVLSFYLRGMSFIDLAYLRKSDLRDGYLTYSRHKTGQRLTIYWEPAMQKIIDRYPCPDSQYLLPIISKEDGTEMRQYRNQMLQVNRKLKIIEAYIHLRLPLTMYVARHSWASIAWQKNISVSVISEALGHTSERTTRIYLSTIQNKMIDEANHSIIHSL